jgi:hypothetical protein
MVVHSIFKRLWGRCKWSAIFGNFFTINSGHLEIFDLPAPHIQTYIWNHWASCVRLLGHYHWDHAYSSCRQAHPTNYWKKETRDCISWFEIHCYTKIEGTVQGHREGVCQWIALMWPRRHGHDPGRSTRTFLCRLCTQVIDSNTFSIKLATSIVP